MHLLAVGAKISKLGIYLRFENGLTGEIPERMISMEVHDVNYRNLPENIHEIGQQCPQAINKIVVYSRSQNLQWNQIFEVSKPCDFASAIQALCDEREKELNAEEVSNFNSTALNVSQMILKRGGDVDLFFQDIR